MNPAQNKIILFRKLSVITLVAVYLLILVGGIVRSTGSGMGCPDWPKCFGSWIPPTEVSQLPSNYKEIYAQKRADKNERFVKYLETLGFTRLADEISNDSGILKEADFNAIKTWTEYINRLVGAFIGLLVIATFIASLAYWRKDNTIVSLSLLTVVAVGFQGWIGSMVVSTNLLPWMITIHMLLALVIVCLLTYIVARSRAEESVLQTTTGVPGVVNATLIIASILTLVQIILGTQVRESVNEVAESFQYQNRQEWIGHLNWLFYVHRSYALIVLAVHFFLVYKIYQLFGKHGNLISWTVVLLMTVLLEILSGAIMAYFSIPRFAQPVHLLLAIGAFGIQFLLILKLNNHLLFRSKISENLKKQHVSYQNCG